MRSLRLLRLLGLLIPCLVFIASCAPGGPQSAATTQVTTAQLNGEYLARFGDLLPPDFFEASFANLDALPEDQQELVREQLEAMQVLADGDMVIRIEGTDFELAFPEGADVAGETGSVMVSRTQVTLRNDAFEVEFDFDAEAGTLSADVVDLMPRFPTDRRIVFQRVGS